MTPGSPTLEKLVLVDDCGVILNPMIVEGQVHGGVAQGLGEAFHEQMLYGDDGQPLTASLLDYAVPRASDMPPLYPRRDGDAESFPSARRQGCRRGRLQRRATRGRQRRDGRAGAPGH